MEIKTGKLTNLSFTADDGTIMPGDLKVVALQYTSGGLWEFYARSPSGDDTSIALIRKGVARSANLPPGFKGDFTHLLQDENNVMLTELKKIQKKAKKWRRKAKMFERGKLQAERQLLELAISGHVRSYGREEEDHRAIDDAGDTHRPAKRQRRSRAETTRDPEPTP